MIKMVRSRRSMSCLTCGATASNVNASTPTRGSSMVTIGSSSSGYARSAPAVASRHRKAFGRPFRAGPRGCRLSARSSAVPLSSKHRQERRHRDREGRGWHAPCRRRCALPARDQLKRAWRSSRFVSLVMRSPPTQTSPDDGSTTPRYHAGDGGLSRARTAQQERRVASLNLEGTSVEHRPILLDATDGRVREAHLPEGDCCTGRRGFGREAGCTGLGVASSSMASSSSDSWRARRKFAYAPTSSCVGKSIR